MRVIVPKAVQLDPLLFDERVSAATPRQKEDLFLDRGCEPDQLHHLTQPFGRYPGPLAHRKNRVRIRIRTRRLSGIGFSCEMKLKRANFQGLGGL